MEAPYKSIDKVICDALSTCTKHMPYENRRDFHSALGTLKSQKDLPNILQGVSVFRQANAENFITFEQARTEVQAEMTAQFDFPRGVRSIKNAIKSAGGMITPDQGAVLDSLRTKSTSYTFTPKTDKEEWRNALIVADETDEKAHRAMSQSFTIAPGQYSNKASQFETLPRNKGFDNDYLRKKKLDKIIGSAFCSNASVIVPLRSAFTEELRGYQTIDLTRPPGKQKLNLKGVPTKSLFYSMGEIQDAETVAFCEGFATGETVAQITGLPTVAVMSGGNFLPVMAGMSYWDGCNIGRALIFGDSGTDDKLAKVCKIAQAGGFEARYITAGTTNG